jgi:acetyl-CoA C-acetyltransferase
MQEAVIVSTARTPIGRPTAVPSTTPRRPVLGGHVIRAALAKAGVDGAEVDDVMLGIAAQQGTRATTSAACAPTPPACPTAWAA